MDKYYRQLANDIKKFVGEGLSLDDAIEKSIENFKFSSSEAWMKLASSYVLPLLDKSMPNIAIENALLKIKNGDPFPYEIFKHVEDISPVIEAFSKESNEVISSILLHMDPFTATSILEGLDETKRYHILVFIAKSDLRTFSRITWGISRKTEKMFFGRLEFDDNKLYKSIRYNYFTFDDLSKLDQRSLIVVLSHITDNDLIVKALRSTKKEVVERIYECVSRGRKIMLDDANANLGMVKMTEVEEAQEKITSIVKQLEKNGEIVIYRGGSDNNDDFIL